MKLLSTNSKNWVQPALRKTKRGNSKTHHEGKFCSVCQIRYSERTVGVWAVAMSTRDTSHTRVAGTERETSNTVGSDIIRPNGFRRRVPDFSFLDPGVFWARASLCGDRLANQDVGPSMASRLICRFACKLAMQYAIDSEAKRYVILTS